jgi:hypothetical protein
VLMATTQLSEDETNMWYIDTECSNHITGNKDWFIKLNESGTRGIKFADISRVNSEVIGSIPVKRKDRHEAIIIYVLCVPNMNSNLISTCQLL